MYTSKSDGRTTQPLGAVHAHRAGRIIAAGGLVVIPTETVYGLAASAVDRRAVASIFSAKGRPADNPLIVHLASRSEAIDVVPSRLGLARAVLEAFAPGPITVVVPAPAWVTPEVCAGLDTVALRVPEHELAREIIAAAGVPVAAPSANRSGRPSPTTPEMAHTEMHGRVDAIVDGGACTIGIESTVVDASSGDGLRILRPGRVTADELRRTLGCRVTEGDAHIADAERARSPGVRYRHYRPDVPVVLFDRADYEDLATELTDTDARVWIITGPGSGARPELSTIRTVRNATWTEYGAALYRTLWEAERMGASVILAEKPANAVVSGLSDRLSRAAETDYRLGIIREIVG